MELAGQTLLVIGGSSGVGLETARLARADGADVIITAREADRLHAAGLELGGSIAAFDASDFNRLSRFFDELPWPVDHVLFAAPGGAEGQSPQAAVYAASKVRPGGTIVFLGCNELDGARRSLAPGIMATALELAPVRVNLIAAGFVDPAEIAELAIHVMTKTAVSGATFQIDGGGSSAPSRRSRSAVD